MDPNELTGKRIKQLRTALGLNQREMCDKFSEYAGRTQILRAMSLSSWETGKKCPPAETIKLLATFFGVSTDYLFGLTDEYTGINAGEKAIGSKRTHDIQIPKRELVKYDQEPIYVVFNDTNYKNQWGICDWPNQQIVFTNFKLKITDKCSYFYGLPSEEITIRNKVHYLLNYEDMMTKDVVMIESLSYDPAIREKINGWYKHSPDKTFLIKSNGLTLSYDGLGYTYNAIAIN